MPNIPRLRLPGTVQKSIAPSTKKISGGAVMNRSHAAITARATKQAKTKTNAVKRNRFNLRHTPQ